MHTTFHKSDVNTFPELFGQIDTQITKAELPALHYWDADQYIEAFFLLINQVLGEPGAMTFPDLAAISPVRRLVIFLFAGRRLVHDLEKAASAGFRVSYDVREKLSPGIEAQFILACKGMTDADWSVIGQSLLEKIAGMVHGLVVGGYRERIGLTNIYPAFWKSVTKDNPLFGDEFQTVNDKLDKCKDVLERQAVEIMQRYLWLLSGMDVRKGLAIPLADKSQAAEAVGESLTIIENLGVLEEFTLMHEWLKWIGPHVEKYRSRFAHRYCELWALLVKHLPVAEECLHVHRAFRLEIPFQYSAYLVEANQDKEWVAFHLAKEHLPLEHISKPELKIVEKRSMDILLPLYFQGAEWYIEMKNRRAYKYAVRLLKKLANYYKKTKQLDRWELYLQGFMKRHTRLRALHEEMRKKGLIS